MKNFFSTSKRYCIVHLDASTVTLFCLLVFIQDRSQGTLHQACEQCAQQQASLPVWSLW